MKTGRLSLQVLLRRRVEKKEDLEFAIDAPLAAW
jgi:hypothetical protein